MPPPIDAGAIAQARADILTRVAELREQKGMSQAAACKAVGVSQSKFIRHRDAFAAGGMEALRPDYSKCGRPKLAQMDEWETTTAKRLYVKTGSVTTALRLLANEPACSEETSAAILKKRTSKHTLTRSLRAQVEVPKSVVAFAKSEKNCRTNFFVNPRTLTFLDPMGQERELRVGDLSERDDMSNNFIGWVDWPWGGDPCSDRFGVRVFRGQNLMQIDVRSLFFQSFCFLVRLRDSYRADDIWQWVGQSYRDHFVPAIGERWERGIWASNKLRGVAIEPGHTPNAERLGGIAALGRRVIESQSPTTKIIENRFNFLQTVCGTIPGQIGRTRGEMERENKLWTECREGRRNPREHFLSFAELSDQIEKKLHYVNHEPVEGLLYQGIPADLYARGVAERGEELQPLAPEQSHLFARDLSFTVCAKAHALVRYTRPDGSRGGWWFHHPSLYRWEGEKLAVYFDKQCPAAGATVVAIRPGRAKEAPIACELVDGCPQFTLGLEELDPQMAGALQRKKGFMDAVRSEYRALGLSAQRKARVSSVQDGAGQRADVEHGIPHTRGRGQRPQPDRVTDQSRAGVSCADRERNPKSGRTAQPLSADADYMRRLEEQFREANPGVAIR